MGVSPLWPSSFISELISVGRWGSRISTFWLMPAPFLHTTWFLDPGLSVPRTCCSSFSSSSSELSLVLMAWLSVHPPSPPSCLLYILLPWAAQTGLSSSKGAAPTLPSPANSSFPVSLIPTPRAPLPLYLLPNNCPHSCVCVRARFHPPLF